MRFPVKNVKYPSLLKDPKIFLNFPIFIKIKINTPKYHHPPTLLQQQSYQNPLKLK